MKQYSITGLTREGFLTKSFALLILMLALPINAATIYSQAFLGTSANNSYVTTNAEGSDNNEWTYDQFTADKSGTVTNITWQGLQQNNTGFTIKISTQQPNTPDTTPSGGYIENISFPLSASLSPAGNGFFNFTKDLTTSFIITAGTNYWITIYSTKAVPTAWLWGNSADGDPQTGAVDYLTGRHTWQSVAGGHRAFSLNGTVSASSVPEPATLWLFGSGLVGLGMFAKRRKN